MCQYSFQRFIPASAVVMDIGSGYCEFINAIRAKKKYAVDINPDTVKFAGREVIVIAKNALSIPKHLNGTIDRVFLSNFLEHLNTKEEVMDVFGRVYALLRSGGKLLILQPNIDLVKERYWDFFDHKVILNGKSLREGLVIAGFSVETWIERFLPYTTKSALPQGAFITRLYLSIPPAFRPFAGQSFVVAGKPEKR
ncbi:class I SAM-dependent methyltransferase [Candidatus Gottesmanbacteria bacterium]|nr:class I SAM-dependent methyltransferase [Candidatus Gottesmanbacteria bacterium]